MPADADHLLDAADADAGEAHLGARSRRLYVASCDPWSQSTEESLAAASPLARRPRVAVRNPAPSEASPYFRRPDPEQLGEVGAGNVQKGRRARNRGAGADGGGEEHSDAGSFGAERRPRFRTEELRTLISQGRERGYLTFEEIAGTLEEVEVTKEQVQDLHAYLIEHGVDVIAEDGLTAYKEAKEEATSRGQSKKPELDLTVEPSLDSLRLYLRSIGRVDLLTAARGDRARQADRAGRHRRQAPHGGGQPAARRLDREGLPRPRAELPGPDPGGLARSDPGGREVRLPPRLQVLDLRHVVDPPGRDKGDRRQGAHHPDPRPHGREAEPGHPRRAPARAADGPRARAGRDRRGAEDHGPRGAGHPARRADADLAREAGGRRGGVGAGRLRRRRPHRGAVRDGDGDACSARTSRRRWTRCRSASAR